MKKNYLILVVLVVLIVASLFIFRGTGKVIDEDNVMKIPVDSITEQAKFYEEGKVRYFVLKGTDGEVKVALDACDVCGGSKGYRQEGDYMICNNCGQRFHVNYLGESNIKGGGCWPSHLEHEIEGNYVIIKKSDLELNAWRF